MISLQYLPHKEIVEKSCDNISDFNTIDSNLEAFGISTEKKHHIYSVLAAILNLGNITFETCVSNDNGCYISNESQETLEKVASLLHITKADIEDALTKRTIEVNKTKIRFVLFDYQVW